jgi:hypothetical protein
MIAQIEKAPRCLTTRSFERRQLDQLHQAVTHPEQKNVWRMCFVPQLTKRLENLKSPNVHSSPDIYTEFT